MAASTTAGTGGAGTCGDGTVGGSEQCDDGDTASGDGCSSACAWETNCQNDNTHYTITCGQTLNGDFFGTYGDIQNLCGKAFLYQDQIFIFTPLAGANVTVTYTASPDQPDMAMFVMDGSCHSALCFADSTSNINPHNVTFQAKSGLTYYIDLEAPSQQPNYSITLQCN
jgi:cysteine-rich repeat protein